MSDIIERLEDFVEYADKTRKYADSGFYKDCIEEITALRQQLEQAEARAEMRREALYDCAVALKDAGSLSKEMHDLIVKANESGGDAWLLRKEADDVDSSVEWLHVNYHHLDGHHLGILTARANRLRQQASEIESGDNNE